MGVRAMYIRRANNLVTAVRLALDTNGFTYRKWGGEQCCKPGDWIVDHEGDVYSVDARTFAATYRCVSPGRYAKCVPVWAEQAERAGSVMTKEGESQYEAGDYLVFNAEDGSDGYAVARRTFEALYERAD